MDWLERKRTLWWILLALTLLGAALRFWHLGTWSPWEDEVLTILDARDFPHTVRINPLPYALTHLSLRLLSDSAWGARFGFALIGSLSVPLMFLLGRAVYHNRAGFWAAFLTAIYPWHIFWSQNARAYALTFAFGGIAAVAFYLGMERDRWRWYLLSLAASFCLLASHLLSILLLPALFAYALAVRLLPVPTPRGWRWRYLIGTFGPFALLGLGVLHPALLGKLTSGWGLNVWGRSPFYVLATFLVGLSVPVAALSLPGMLQVLTGERRDHLFLTCIAVIPVVLFLAASIFLNVGGYYLFFSVPAYLLLAAWGLSQIVEMNPRLTWPVPLLVVGVLLSQVALYHQEEFGGRPRWEEAFRRVQAEAGPTDNVVLPIPRLMDYYWPEHQGTRYKPKQLQADGERLWHGWQKRGLTTWFLLDAPTLEAIDPQHTFRNWLYAHAHLVRRYPANARMMDRSISVYRLDADGRER